MKTNKLLTSFMMVFLITNLFFLIWYIFFGYQAFFHSDSATKVLLAREIFDSGRFFPQDWNYVNGDLFILFGHVIIIPLLAVLPAGFTVHAVSGFVFSGLILYGLWLITGLGDIPLWRRLAVVAIFAAGISGFIAENLFGQVSYGVVIFFCCYILYSSWRFLSAQGRQSLTWAALLTGLLILAYWANPIRAFLTYGLPLLASLVWLALFCEVQNKKKFLWLIGLTLGGAVAGYGLHSISIADLNNVKGAADARWLSFDLILRNFPLALKGIFAQLGGLPVGDAPLFSMRGVYAGMRFAAAMLVLILIPVAIVRTLRSSALGMKLLALFAAFLVSLTLFIQLTTSLPDMSNPIQSSRYLVPGIVLSLTVVLMMPVKFAPQPILGLTISGITFVLISSGFMTYQMSNLNSEILGQPAQVNPARLALVETLEDNNLQYGYATYWNAGVLSVLSDEKSRIRQIKIQNGLPVPMKHLSSNRWYWPTEWRGKTFLLLKDHEIDDVSWQRMERLGLSSSQQLHIEGHTIFVFEENIAKYLPGWDTHYYQPFNFLPREDTMKRIGRFVDDGIKPSLIAEKGEAGALHYGPYVDVEPGRYRVTFDVQAAHNPRGSVRLDVAAAPDQKLLGEITLNVSAGPQTSEFSLDETRTLEFRVWALGNEKVIFNNVTILRVQDQ